MAIKDTYINTHCGTKQSERMPEALVPDYVQIDERTFEDLVAQIAAMAPRMRFYTTNSNTKNWKSFFSEYYNYDKGVLDIAHLQDDMTKGKVLPHMALILTFVKLFAYQQQGLNQLTQRQIDFYYKQILGFMPRKGSYGSVPVVVELTRPAQNAFLPKGTLFDAGKDEQSKPIYYESKYDATLNKAQIVQIKKQIDKQFFKLSDTSNMNAEKLSVYLECKDLLLKDGNRTITITCPEFKSEGIAIEFTTEKGWEKVNTNTNNVLTILASQPAFAPYKASVHGECFETESPMLRLTTTKWDAINKLLLGKNITLTIKIEKSQDFLITNSLGLVENRRGAMPFGTKCHMGDFFTITLPHKPDTLTTSQVNQWDIVFNNNTGINKTNIHQVVADKKNDQIPNPQAVDIKLITNDYNLDEYNLKLSQYLSKAISKSPGQAVKPIELLNPITIGYSYKTCDVKVAFTAESATVNINKEALTKFYNTTSDSSLFIELKDMPDSGQLNLMVNMDPFIAQDIKDLQWNLFDGKEWHTLRKADLLYDTTNGLKQSGIIHLNIIYPGVHWLKADFTGTYKFNALKSIATQVVELIPSSTSPGQATVGIPLPAETIKKLVTSVQGIKSVKQTIDGYEADYDETNDQFICRTSEYLRHKGRAWTPWDYERIVLQKFPQISQVMCYTSNDGTKGNMPGHVLLVVIPKSLSNEQRDNTEPKVEASLLTTIKEFVQRHTSAMVTVHTQNPQYERIEVTCKATLKSGCNDKEQYGAILARDLTIFLAPWINKDTKLTIQRTLNESDIMAFIKGQPYVDDILNLRVKQDNLTVEMGSYLTPKNIAGILTSSKEHKITFV